MHAMASSPSTGVCSMVCLKVATPLTKNSANPPVQLVKSWGNTTRTATSQFTTPWFVWPKNFRCAIRWLMVKEISGPLTATHLLLCVTQRVDWIVSQNTCWMTSTKIRSISNRILMILSKNPRCSPLVSLIFCSTEAMELLSVWQRESHPTTLRRWLVPLTSMWMRFLLQVKKACPASL